MTTQARKPKGTRTGGQFAETLNPESTIDLMALTEAATYDFGNSPVAAHRHGNGGGWVAETAHVDLTAYVGSDAVVRDEARVLLFARVAGRSIVEDHAVVSGNALVIDSNVSNDAMVTDDARVVGNSYVTGRALVGNHATLSQAQVTGDTRVVDFGVVCGGALFDRAEVSGHAMASGQGAKLNGDTTLTGAGVEESWGPEFGGCDYEWAKEEMIDSDYTVTQEVWEATVSSLRAIEDGEGFYDTRYHAVCDALSDIAEEFHDDPEAARAKYTTQSNG